MALAFPALVEMRGLEPDGTTEVGWSDALNRAPHTPGSPVTLPDGIGRSNGSVIVSEISFDYDSLFGEYLGSVVAFDHIFYVRPRRTLRVTRVNQLERI